MVENRKLTKNEKRRLREKEVKAAELKMEEEAKNTIESAVKSGTGRKKSSRFKEEEVEIEYVSADLHSMLEGNDMEESKAEFVEIFSKFTKPEDLTLKVPEKQSNNISTNVKDDSMVNERGMDLDVDVDEMEMEMDDQPTTLSSRQRRKMSRPTISQLKLMVNKPEVVEAHDITALDPIFLINLKAMRNTVPVPGHWGSKKKYLSGKRGVEKPPFELPTFIADTGINRIRSSLMEAEAAKKTKAKARSKVRPSMGKIDIDYQVLHDAFFKYQIKPQLTKHGELYYEGKENEMSYTSNRNKKPGDPLSETLLEALGMKNNNIPPPWLISQQRYGPPPSYYTIKIPGLSTTIPHGASFGYHAGGWGRPPVDEYGRPLYGDVFGTGVTVEEGEDIVDVGTLWGEMLPVNDDSDDSDNDSDNDSDTCNDNDEGYVPDQPDTLADDMNASTATATGMAAIMNSNEIQQLAEETIDLRKRDDNAATSTSRSSIAAIPKGELFAEIKQTTNTNSLNSSGELFGSDKVYDLGKSNVDVDGSGNGNQQNTTAATGTSVEVEDEQPKKKKKVASASVAAKKSLDNFKF